MHGQFAYSLNVSSLLDFDTEIIDISLVMFLKVLESMGIKKVAFAGFDGYSCNDNNYCRGSISLGIKLIETITGFLFFM